VKNIKYFKKLSETLAPFETFAFTM